MDFIAVYPKIEPRPNARLIYRTVIGVLLSVACMTCGIVNLCLKGRPWALFVFGGAVVLWSIFLYHPIVEFSHMQRASAILMSVCGYLFLIDWLTDAPYWSRLVVPIVLFSVFVLELALFFLFFRRQKHNIFPLYSVFLVTIAIIVLSACGVFNLTFNWPMIVLAALDGLLVILSIFFFRTPLAAEWKKKFHTR